MVGKFRLWGQAVGTIGWDLTTRCSTRPNKTFWDERLSVERTLRKPLSGLESTNTTQQKLCYKRALKRRQKRMSDSRMKDRRTGRQTDNPDLEKLSAFFRGTSWENGGGGKQLAASPNYIFKFGSEVFTSGSSDVPIFDALLWPISYISPRNPVGQWSDPTFSLICACFPNKLKKDIFWICPT